MRGTLLLGVVVLVGLLVVPYSATAVEPVPGAWPDTIRVTIAGAGLFNGVHFCDRHADGFYYGRGNIVGVGARLTVQFGAYRIDKQSAEVHTYMRAGIATQGWGFHWFNKAPGLPAWNVICAPEAGTPGAVRVESP